MDDERVRLPVAGTNSFLLFLFKSIILKLRHRFGLNTISQYPIHINTSERNRGMDIQQLKQRIDASGKKLVTLGNDCMNTRTKPVQKCPTKHHYSSRSSITAQNT